MISILAAFFSPQCCHCPRRGRLTALLDDDAVLLPPGTPPIVGKAALHDFMKQAIAKSPSVKAVKYMPDIQVARVATSRDSLPRSGKVRIRKRAKACVPIIRVMKRQPDGSWEVHARDLASCLN